MRSFARRQYFAGLPAQSMRAPRLAPLAHVVISGFVTQFVNPTLTLLRVGGHLGEALE